MQKLTRAITQRRVMTIIYLGGGMSSIEPHGYGVSKKGNELLRAYQIGGDSEEGHRVGQKPFTIRSSYEPDRGEEVSGQVRLRRPKWRCDRSGSHSTADLLSRTGSSEDRSGRATGVI